MRDIDAVHVFLLIFALIIAIPVHEFAHALSAVNSGDDGPRRAGRLSLMPWDHFDPAGALFCLFSAVFGIGLGWGRPVLVNPAILRRPRWDMCKIAAWGPFSNFLLAVAFALPLRFDWVAPQTLARDLLGICLQVNLGLMLFNLLPIGPLDGAKVLAAFLPDRQAYEFSKFMERYGMPLLFALIMFGQQLLVLLIDMPRGQLLKLLLGF